MLLKNRQLSLICSVTLLLTSPVYAGGNLSISPDQNTDASQLQLESGSTSGGSSSSSKEAETMQAAPVEVTSDLSVKNANLDQVDPNSNVVFEVPLRIETDGTVPEAYDRNTSSETNMSGKPIDRIFVECHITDHDQGPYTHYTGRKVVSLDKDGDFEGTVKIGITINEDTSTPFTNSDGSKRGWRCYMAPVPTGSNMPLATNVIHGRAYKNDDTGTFN